MEAKVEAPPVVPDEAVSEAERSRLKVCYLAVGLTTILVWASFHPLDFGMLAWFALVPWLYVAFRETKRAAAIMSYTTTFLYHLLGLSWIALVTAPGWITTTFLEGFYSLALVLLVRWMKPRLNLPYALLIPPLWVMGEHHRGAHLGFIKFPWLFMGHTQHGRSWLIQIADVTSVYGISFLVVTVNAFILDALFFWEAHQKNPDPVATSRMKKLALYVGGLLVAANLYGAVRSAQVEKNIVPGPKILAVQCNFPQEIKDSGLTIREIVNTNLSITRLGLSQLTKPETYPDAILWSETIWLWPLNTKAPDYTGFQSSLMSYYEGLARKNPTWNVNADALAREVVAKDRELYRLGQQYGCDVIVGGMERTGGDLSHIVNNSYYQLGPKKDGSYGFKERYDKINLVPASEGIPGKDSLLFGWFYRLIKSFVPEGFVTLDPGTGPKIFELGKDSRWKLSPDICFEISFPELLRDGARLGADVLVCPSNDAWFWAPRSTEPSAELALAFDHAQLRAIESRRGVVRIVNRGVTCFIDPLGRKVAEVTGRAKETRELTNVDVEGFICDNVPTSSCSTVYVAIGDTFAWLTWLATFGLIGLSWRRGRVSPPTATTGKASS